MTKPLRTPARSTRSRRRLPTVRSLLIILVTAAVVPVFLFSAWLVVLQSQREKDALEQRLLSTAQRIAGDVDREVASTVQLLQTLAVGFDSGRSGAREFQEISNRILAAQTAWKSVIVRDASGKPLVTISSRANEVESAASESEENLGIFTGGKQAAISSPLAFLVGSSVDVNVPIRVEEKTAYFAIARLDPQVFAGLLRQHKLSRDWLVSILDPKKIVVASTRLSEKLFGKPAQLFHEDPGASAPGHFFRSNVEDVPSYVLLSTAPVSGWSVALVVPAEVVEAPYYRMLWLVIGAGVLCITAGALLAYLIGRKVARPLEALAADANERLQGRPVISSPDGNLAEVEIINEALDQSAHLLKDRQQERDYLSEQLDVRLNDLTGLHKLTTSLLAIDEQEALYNEIITGALILFKAEKGSLHLTEEEKQRLELVAQIGFGNGDATPVHSPARTAMATRRPVIIEDVEQNNSILDEEERKTAAQAAVRAALSVPLTRRGGDIIGALSTYFLQPSKPSPWQEILFDLYARYCVAIIDQMAAKEELEKRVTDHAKRLEQAYLQRIQDLTRQKELEKGLREAQKMELVATLAGGVAHDFNNILNIILSYASSLDTENEAEFAEGIKTIKGTVQRGSSLVTQLLAVARKTETKFEATDLNDLIRKLIALLAQTLPKNIIIAAEFDPKIPLVMLDSNQISQAVINLCVNARDAMPGGGKLAITTQYLDPTAARQQYPGAKAISYGCVTVSDTGVGIQDEAKERVFEPFFTTKGPGRGTGLGLSVVYRIMQAHDGFVHFESGAGCGTRFHLYFPIREASGVVPCDEASEKMSVPSVRRGATILVVEDEPNQITLLRKVFEKEGYSVLTASESDTALAIFNGHRNEIALVLLDLGLPGTNGWMLFQKMRDIDPAVKVLFATGYMPPELDLDTVQTESCGIVIKPYDLTDVLNKIAVIIGEGTENNMIDNEIKSTQTT